MGPSVLLLKLFSSQHCCYKCSRDFFFFCCRGEIYSSNFICFLCFYPDIWVNEQSRVQVTPENANIWLWLQRINMHKSLCNNGKTFNFRVPLPVSLSCIFSCNLTERSGAPVLWFRNEKMTTPVFKVQHRGPSVRCNRQPHPFHFLPALHLQAHLPWTELTHIDATWETFILTDSVLFLFLFLIKKAIKAGLRVGSLL